MATPNWSELRQRPCPPRLFVDNQDFKPYIHLVPAEGVHEWIHAEILSEEGTLHNPDHIHLLEADIVFMWASNAFAKKGRMVLGQCEEVMMRAGGWQKARMEQQLHEWFVHIPEFIITLAADYCAQCSDLEFCALVEHELYHIAQETDEFGAPKFYRDSGLS